MMNKKDEGNSIDLAFEVAFSSMRENLGGPFGAVVVKDGRVIGKGANHVFTDKDPTAHAEIVAIRSACKSIGNIDLSGATIFTTCEPCPMCLSAIYWSHISKVCYASTRHDAEKIGFLDNHIYQEIGFSNEKRSVKFEKITHPLAPVLFLEWEKKIDKITY